jgi:hypothetical protein
MGRVERERRRAGKRRRGSVSVSVLRSEGVIEVGRISSVLYVLTERGLRLFHAAEVSAW